MGIWGWRQLSSHITSKISWQPSLILLVYRFYYLAQLTPVLLSFFPSALNFLILEDVGMEAVVITFHKQNFLTSLLDLACLHVLFLEVDDVNLIHILSSCTNFLLHRPLLSNLPFIFLPQPLFLSVSLYLQAKMAHSWSQMRQYFHFRGVHVC